jgi:two-component system, NarL family, response regulator DesR
VAIRILLAEDIAMVRGALVALMELESDFSVVADVGRGDEIVPAAKRTRPDVAVIDIDLPGVDGLTAANDLHRELPGCRTLILTSLDRPGTLRRALSMHVAGFLLKDADPARLAEAVRAVASGRRVIDPQLAVNAWDSMENPLSRRETEVLRLAGKGANPGEIAKQLYLSSGTVRNYLTTIVAKLGARNRVDAIRIAQEAGWIP